MASIVGMGEALRREEMIALIAERIPGATLNGDPVNRIPGNINMLFEGIESEAALIKLDLEGVACSGGSACTSGSIEPSHVLISMGIPPRQAKGALRFTLGRENTAEEVRQAVKILKGIVAQLRQ